jgi:hypothetical protein
MGDLRGPGKPVKHRPAQADQHSQVGPTGKWRIGCFTSYATKRLWVKLDWLETGLSATLEGEGA